MNSKFHQHLPALFGLGSLTSPSSTVIGTESVTWVHSWWAIELPDFQFMSREYIVMSVVKTGLWTKGAVLIPERGKDVLKAHQPMHSVELTDWIDYVEVALFDIDLFPNKALQKTWRAPHAVFSLQFRNSCYSGEFSQHDQANYAYSAHSQKLQSAIFSTLLSLVNLYNNEEMRAFVEYYRTIPYLFPPL